jgi:hypothetical protein
MNTKESEMRAQLKLNMKNKFNYGQIKDSMPKINFSIYFFGFH